MLWLIRHGESRANAGSVTSDYSAIPLTERGRAQAEAVAAGCHRRPDRVVVSPYLRARQTAEPLLARYPDVPVEVRSVQEFTYLALGRAGGMDGAARQPLVDAYWSRMDPDHCDGDGAESFAGLLGRAREFLGTAEDWQGLTLTFTHEQFIRAVLSLALYGGSVPPVELMGRFFALRAGMPIPNAAVVRLERREGRWWVGGVETP